MYSNACPYIHFIILFKHNAQDQPLGTAKRDPVGHMLLFADTLQRPPATSIRNPKCAPERISAVFVNAAFSSSRLSPTYAKTLVWLSFPSSSIYTFAGLPVACTLSRISSTE